MHVVQSTLSNTAQLRRCGLLLILVLASVVPVQAQSVTATVEVSSLPAVEGSSRAVMLVLKKDVDPRRLPHLKHRLRRLFPHRYCLIQSGGDPVITALNCVHAPEPENCAREFALLRMI